MIDINLFEYYLEIVLLTSIAIIFIFFLIYVNRKRDIILTYETTIRITIMIFLMGILMLTVFFYGIFVGVVLLEPLSFTLFSFVNIFSLFLYFFPCFFAIYSYISIKKYYTKKYALFPVKNSAVNSRIRHISKLIELERPPRIMCPKEKQGVFIFGSSSKNTYLVLPRDLIKEIKNYKKLDKANKQRIDTLLFHELSHIKNGDVPFISWAEIFTRTIIIWLILLFPFELINM